MFGGNGIMSVLRIRNCKVKRARHIETHLTEKGQAGIHHSLTGIALGYRGEVMRKAHTVSGHIPVRKEESVI